VSVEPGADDGSNDGPNGGGQGAQQEEAPASGGQHGMALSFGFGTDRGLRRELNEDSFLAADPIFAVADGMGGHEAGEVASRECISVLSQQTVLAAGSRGATAVDLQQALRQADSRIREICHARAGTTVTGVVLVEERGVPYWLVFNVGDSRTYRLSQGSFGQVSVDHSEVQELVDGGLITPAEALVHPRRHVVTRALGTGPDTEADYWLVPVEDGDRILVCSDGLTGEVSDEGIHRALITLPHPQDVVDSLIQAALRSGGRDNVTVVVVDASHVDGTAPETMTKPFALTAEGETRPRVPGNGTEQAEPPAPAHETTIPHEENHG
jgi:protein phosphatase